MHRGLRGSPSEPQGGEFAPHQTERDILDLAAIGLTDKEVAAGLSLSASTVRSHLERFYRAIGLRNKARDRGWARRADSKRRS